jgi:hypothetical protein
MKLFLDVDGVLNPDLCPDNNDLNSWGDWRHKRIGLGYNMLVSDLMLQSFKDTCRKFDIEIVWATTWVIRDYVNLFLEYVYFFPADQRKIEWEPYGFKGFEVVRGCGKLPGVQFDDDDPNEPIIWIDDCLGPEDYEWAESRPGRSLLIKTDPRYGISPEDIQAIYNFARGIYVEPTIESTSQCTVIGAKRLEDVRDESRSVG